MTREVYNKSVDILLDAYNEERLEHDNCTACAVGNLLHGSRAWIELFITVDGKQELHHYSGVRAQEEALNKIQSNGYTVKELAAIEYAFESAIWNDEDVNQYIVYMGKKSKEGQLMGLRAVLNVMATMIEDDKESTIEQDIQRLEVIAHDKWQVAIN